MRASETVSEASPGSTASQTGVPTQVVQQVQGTQQVRLTPPLGGWEGTCVGVVRAVAEDTSPSFPDLPLEPSAYLSLSRCSLQLPLHPPGLGHLGKLVWLRAFLLAPTAAAGPDECAGQARPHVTPSAHQHPCAPAGKSATPGPGPHSLPRVQNQPLIAFGDLPSPASRTWAYLGAALPTASSG